MVEAGRVGSVRDGNRQRGLVTTEKKIIPLGTASTLCESLRAQGKRIVHCHGVFDLLHIGHIKHLEAARNLGDLLVVTITPDRFVNKGPRQFSPSPPRRQRNARCPQ